MKKNYLYYAIGCFYLSLISSNSLAVKLSGASGTIAAIVKPLHATIHRTERLFEQNNGAEMSSSTTSASSIYPTPTGSTTSSTSTEGYSTLSGDNPYISSLRITKDYHVELTLSGTTNNVRGYKSPVAKSLLGAKILLIPIYNSGDEFITTWECITNADQNTQAFQGDAGNKEYSASFIRDYTSSPLLSKCIYVKGDVF